MEYDGKIQERLFHEYDANHFLVGIIEDDGSKLNSNDLTNITYRRQKVISPVSDSNQLSFGKPQKICEYYVCNSKPILLKTTHLTYDYLGYETTQAINDSQNNVCYTLVTKYNDKHQIASQTNALNETTLYEDDRFGNKIKEIFVDGHREISYAYDLNGNLVRKEEINTKTKDTFEYSYNAIGQLIQETDSFGNKINYEYDRLGRQTVCKKPYIEALDGKKIRPTVTKRYNIFNCIEEEIDENSHKTTSSYTAYGKPLEICYPDGSKERFSYYLNGQLKQKLEADGSSTEYSYDPKGRITVQRTLGPHGFELKKEEYTYKGPFLICKKDPMEVKIFYEYDAAGRKSKEIVENQIIAYEYDDFDRLIKIKRFESATNGQVEIFAYDHLNRITSKELQDFSGTLYGKETSEYDRFGNVAKKVVWNNPQKNASYQSKYHSNGDLKYQIDPLGNKTQFSYNYAHINEFGHKVKCTGIQDPLGQMTVEVQDPLHRVIRVNFHGKGSTDILSSTHYVYSPSGQKLRQEEVDHQGKKYVIEWTYNSQGLVESQTEVSSGKRTFYHYDSMKRLKEKIKPDGTSLYYTYDRYGRIETLTSSDKTIHYVLEYDLNDNPTKIKDLVQNITQKRLYDRLNRLIKEELSEGLSVEYTYDPLNRITQVKLPDSSCIRYEYDAFYLKKILRLKKDGTLAYTYECQERDFQGNLIQAASQTFVVQNKFDLLGRKVQVKSSYFSSDLLSFDPLGNLLALKQSCFFKEKNENFTYDRFSQITSESEHQYTFDSLGNCIQKDGKAQIVNTSNQLIQDETATYKYSDNGSLVFVSNPETFYKYDALERLISSKQKEEKVRYIFDFFGRCLFIKDALGTRQLIYLGLQEIGSIKDCAIDTLRLVNPENSETFAIELQDEVSFPIQDHRHNICALQRMDGTLAQAITYTAFGQEQLFNESEEIINPWHFANRRSTHGLLLFAHRFYNPKLMRWQTQDLLGFEDGPHLYAYVHNNPLTHFDLFGLQDLDLRHLSFWERWQEMDFESFAAKATYSPTTLAAHAWTGVSQGLFEGYMDPIDSASNHFSSDRSSADITEQFRFGGKSLGVVGGTAIALANTANQVVKSGVTYVAKIGTNKVISHTVDKAKSVASERLSIQHLPSQGAESPNAAINLNRKLSRLEKFQQNAVKTRELPDGRVRYYDQETFSQKNGPTRGACNVVEWNPKTGNVRGWYECYDHKGNINRVHPKNINGQLIKSPHYPPTGSEIIR